MSHAGNLLYPLSGTEYKLVPNKPISINLDQERIPKSAFEVIVYAKVDSGYVQGKDQSGELVVSTTTLNGTIERKLFYHVYGQSAWSYNSENIPLPVAAGYTQDVAAELKGPDGGSFRATVQIVGYKSK